MTSPNQAPNTQAQTENFYENLAEINNEFQNPSFVPSLEDLQGFQTVANGITETAPGIYETADGTAIDEEVASAFKQNVASEHWIMDDKQAKAAQKIFEASSLGELSQTAQKTVLKQRHEGETDTQAFERVQAEAENRLHLSEQLQAIKQEAVYAREEKEDRANARMTDQEKQSLFNIDANGEMKLTGANGQEMTAEQQKAALDHADLIRRGLPGLLDDVVTVDRRGIAHRKNGQTMSRQEVIDLSNDKSIAQARETAKATAGAENMTDEEKAILVKSILEQITGASAAATANIPSAPQTEPERRNWFQRKRDAFMGLATHLTVKEKKAAKYAGIGLIGLAAVQAFMAYKGLSHGGGGHTNADPSLFTSNGGGKGNVDPSMFTSNGGSGAAHGHFVEVASQTTVKPSHEVVTLHKGDTPWSAAEDHLTKQLGHKPTNQQIVAETHRLEELNHFNEEEATKLKVGTKIKF